MTVQRYGLNAGTSEDLEKDSCGDYVLFSDYLEKEGDYIELKARYSYLVKTLGELYKEA